MWESFASRPAGFANATSGSLVLACVSLLRFWPRKFARSLSSLPSLRWKLFCEAQASIRSRPPKMLVRQSRLDLRMRLVHKLRKHVAVLQPLTVLREAGRVPTGSATAPRTSSTSDCSPIAPSAVVPTECRRTPAQQLLRRDRGASFVRIELTKATVQLAQHITDKRPNPFSADGSAAPTSRRDVRKQPALIHK